MLEFKQTIKKNVHRYKEGEFFDAMVDSVAIESGQGKGGDDVEDGRKNVMSREGVTNDDLISQKSVWIS